MGQVSLHLAITYDAPPNTRVVVSGPSAAFGSSNLHDAPALVKSTTTPNLWTLTVQVPAGNEPVQYRYAAITGGGEHPRVRWEAGVVPRRLSLVGLPDGAELYSHDSWRSPKVANVFVTKAFTSVVFGPRGVPKVDSALGEMGAANDWNQGIGSRDGDSVAVRFIVLVPRLVYGHSVHLTGGLESFGAWMPDKKVRLVNLSSHFYGVIMRIPRAEFEAAIAAETKIEYKYAVYDSKDEMVYRERGDSRVLELPKGNPDCKYLNIDEIFTYRSTWKGAGLALPVSAINTYRSMGVGEFTDIKKLVDWANKVGLQLIQVLPINDTGLDPSPYSANSVFALHPIYINVQTVAESVFGHGKVPREIQDEIDLAVRELNSNKKLDYRRVLDWKMRFMSLIYEAGKHAIEHDSAMQAWAKNEASWLDSYACWKAIVEKTEEWVFTKWDVTVKDVPKLIAKGGKYHDEARFIFFVQYHLAMQLSEASEYARRHGVVLKGDLPIGVSRYCADTWASPQFFQMGWSAGAPSSGPPPAQNWDFPLYDWNVMKADNYSWWRRRLTAMSTYFQAFRIDHVLGFFRIWGAPAHNYSGLHGRFVPCIPVSKAELDKAGITDIKRLTEPYIRTYMLKEKLPTAWEEVAKQCLERIGETEMWKFKEEYNTQEKIRNLIPLDGTQKNQKINDVLFELIDNVLLLQDEKGFYPTCHMKHCHSYEKYGDLQLRGKLDGLWQNFFWERQSWRQEGFERLAAMQEAADMMICAEDLGAVPNEAFEVLDDLGILGLRIQRWPAGGGDFGCPDQYPYLSVCAPSCHDCSTVRGWWEEDRWRCHEFYRKFYGPNAPHHCDDWVSQKVIESHLASSSMWAIIPIQDYLDMWGELRSANPKDDEINRPGQTDGCWVYRMPWSVEQLMEKDHFNGFLRGMVDRNGRSMAF